MLCLKPVALNVHSCITYNMSFLNAYDGLTSGARLLLFLLSTPEVMKNISFMF